MAHNGKQGFFSSLFGKRKQTEWEATAELESKQRLEARIEQILAERVAVPELHLMEENQDAAISPQQEEPEIPVELLPISASVISRRKAPVPAVFLLSTVDESQSYASNAR